MLTEMGVGRLSCTVEPWTCPQAGDYRGTMARANGNGTGPAGALTGGLVPYLALGTEKASDPKLKDLRGAIERADQKLLQRLRRQQHGDDGLEDLEPHQDGLDTVFEDSDSDTGNLPSQDSIQPTPETQPVLATGAARRHTPGACGSHAVRRLARNEADLASVMTCAMQTPMQRSSTTRPRCAPCSIRWVRTVRFF
jgi:hypothetical protein